ncbi:MAG: hypothetical protein QXT40_02035 [Candidatus Micrarchaeia archaeon]
MQEFNSKFSFKNRVINSLENLESAAKKLKNKVKTSTLDDGWFKKINSHEYESISRSIELWIDILEHAEIKRKMEKK